ncbi:MAG: type IV pilus biogenesis/stability protein PilW [Gammaproteobacteria bacterium]|nr:type IV pilus biogenesis/stability protein PilW [Gammaproteobacteria bacterium]MCP5135486.1 type IV pilus biogenesis/stability protein PilW [Gammaproteobacteria bacterium]
MKRLSILLIVCVGLLSGCPQTGDVKEPEAVTAAQEHARQVAEINTKLGIEYMRQNRNEQALEKFEKALASDPGYAPAPGYAAVLYERIGRLDDADAAYRRALELEPDNASIRNNYARYLCSHDQFEAAEENFRQVIANKLYPTPEIAMVNAGLCARLEPDLIKAERYFNDALTTNPNFAIALYELAKLAYVRNDYLQARAYLQRYFQVAGYSPASLWLGVRVERALNDPTEVARYTYLLKSRFADSQETRLLNESQTDGRNTN